MGQRYSRDCPVHCCYRQMVWLVSGTIVAQHSVEAWDYPLTIQHHMYTPQVLYIALHCCTQQSAERDQSQGWIITCCGRVLCYIVLLRWIARKSKYSIAYEEMWNCRVQLPSPRSNPSPKSPIPGLELDFVLHYNPGGITPHTPITQIPHSK